MFASNTEVRDSNPVLGRIYIEPLFNYQQYWIDENEEKETGNGSFKNNDVRYLGRWS